MSNYDYPDGLVFKGGHASDWWRPGGREPCWVCGTLTEWAWLDLGFQHPDCDLLPTDDGECRIVGGHHVA